MANYNFYSSYSPATYGQNSLELNDALRIYNFFKRENELDNAKLEKIYLTEANLNSVLGLAAYYADASPTLQSMLQYINDRGEALTADTYGRKIGKRDLMNMYEYNLDVVPKLAYIQSAILNYEKAVSTYDNLNNNKNGDHIEFMYDRPNLEEYITLGEKAKPVNYFSTDLVSKRALLLTAAMMQLMNTKTDFKSLNNKFVQLVTRGDYSVKDLLDAARNSGNKTEETWAEEMTTNMNNFMQDLRSTYGYDLYSPKSREVFDTAVKNGVLMGLPPIQTTIKQNPSYVKPSTRTNTSEGHKPLTEAQYSAIVEKLMEMGGDKDGEANISLALKALDKPYRLEIAIRYKEANGDDGSPVAKVLKQYLPLEKPQPVVKKPKKPQGGENGNSGDKKDESVLQNNIDIL